MVKLTADIMRNYVESHPQTVSCKTFSDYPELRLLKYKNKVFYKNLWDSYNVECRGTVVDAKTFEPVVRPFTKVFNFDEKGAPKIDRDEPVFTYRKVNGFMAAASMYNGEVIVSTTGSLYSPFSELARDWIMNRTNMGQMIYNMGSGITWLFEVVDSTDPHIVVENEGLYLLAVRYNEWDYNTIHNDGMRIADDFFDLDEIAEYAGAERPEFARWKRYSDVKEELYRVQHEGFMVYTRDQDRVVKMKSPYYKTIKFLGRTKDDRLIERLQEGQFLKKVIDEEFYSIVEHLENNLDAFLALDQQDRIVYIRNFFNTELFD